MPKTKKRSKSKKSLLRKKSSLLTKLLFITGAIFLGISLIWNLNQTIQLKFFTPKVPVVEKTALPPLSLSIPSINMTLQIEETAIQNNSWEISKKGASHLTTSANPSEQGPIILYGHNTNDRFGPIRRLNPGKEILITTADEKVHTYIISETTVVDPTETSIFFSRKGETLYLYTCDGFADLKRFVVIATPKLSNAPTNN